MKLASVLLACFAVTQGIPFPFPHGKTIIYNYYGDVKAGIIEPAAYASQYALSGQLYIKHDTSDPSLTNAYYVVLKNVKTGLHNGLAAHYQQTNVLEPIPDAAKMIEDPFLIVYNETGQLQGVKIPENEAGWSKNMKLAMASMLQLDLSNMKLESPIKPHSFISKENTIHGDCYTSYDVQGLYPSNPDQSKDFIVTKFGSPRNCSNYNVHVFNHVDDEGCELIRERPVNMASRRFFELKNEGENILIKKLVAHGGVNYFPYKGRSEAHYVLNNATFVLDNIVPSSEIKLDEIDFQSMQLITDVSYQKPQGTYGSKTGVDLTQGRHTVQQHILIVKLKKMLEEAADYLEENHLDAKEPDFKHGQTINRMLYTMSYMEIDSFDKVFSELSNEKQRDQVIKNLFIGMIPQVGTMASSIFAKNIIIKQKIGTLAAMTMLAQLPLNIRVPTEDLLIEIESMIKGDASMTKEVRKASILSFSTLIFRTFKKSLFPEKNPTLNLYLNYFYDHLLNEPTYEMKIVYLMAIRNIQVGKILELLTPIIRGDIEVSEEPMRIRLMSIWAVQKSIPNYNIAHDIFWSIMSDYNNPLKIRIAAYDILIHQAPSMTNILHIYWFMVYEKNQHLYNYHHTTIKGLANSVDPCEIYLREMTTKIMRFTRIHDPVPYKLSASYMFDSMDEVYGHGEKIQSSMVLSETTGVAEVFYLEHTVIEGRKRISDWAIQVHIEGMEKTPQNTFGRLASQSRQITDPNVLELLLKIASQNPVPKNLLVDIIVLKKGRVVLANNYDKNTLLKLEVDIKRLLNFDVTQPIAIHKEIIDYENIYEQQVISEMGLPIVMETRIPMVTSLKLNLLFTSMANIMNAKIEFDARIWRHGDYSMSIYNPLVDVWHSIRRSTATDIAIPLKASLTLNSFSNLFDIIFHQLSSPKFSTSGAKTHAKDCTTVTEDENDSLKKSCPTCNYHEVVTTGFLKKNTNEIIYDSKDTGLQMTTSIFDCENKITFSSLTDDLLRALQERKNSWNDEFTDLIFATRQGLKNILISPQMGSCGSIIKIESSNANPTSHLKLTWRLNLEEYDSKNLSLPFLIGRKANIRGSLDAISSITNTSLRTWEGNFEFDTSPGHLLNTMKIQLTRITPGEKNLKICLDGQKSYPEIPNDLLKLGLTKEETNTKLTISIANTNEDKCIRDEGLIIITVKGVLSDEQKKLFTQESIFGQCSVDIKNPLYSNPKKLIPKTINCLDEAIKYTTLRKYFINISHKNVPLTLKSLFLKLEDFSGPLHENTKYSTEYLEPGLIKIKIEFPIKNDSMLLSVTKPDISYDMDLIDDFINLPPRHIGFGPDLEKHLWSTELDNTRFPMEFLEKYVQNEFKYCTLYPKTVLTLDGGKILYDIPNEWTLATGDFFTTSFAVFVKNSNDKLALRIYVEDRIIEILPVDENVQIKVNNEIIYQNDQSFYVLAADEINWVVKLTKKGEDITVEISSLPLVIIHSQNSVTLSLENHLQRTISGLCGQIDGQEKSNITKIYHL